MRVAVIQLKAPKEGLINIYYDGINNFREETKDAAIQELLNNRSPVTFDKEKTQQPTDTLCAYCLAFLVSINGSGSVTFYVDPDKRFN